MASLNPFFSFFLFINIVIDLGGKIIDLGYRGKAPTVGYNIVKV